MSDPRHPQQVPAFGRERPLVYEWVGELVVLGYVDAPDFSGDPNKRARGQLEVVTALYDLREVSALGVVVRRVTLTEEGEFDRSASRFIPWSAVQYIQGLPKDEDERKKFGV